MNLWGVGVKLLFGHVLRESGLMSLWSRVKPKMLAQNHFTINIFLYKLLICTLD